MIRSYKRVTLPQEALHKHLEHLVKNVWCGRGGAFQLDSDPVFKSLVQEVDKRMRKGSVSLWDRMVNVHNKVQTLDRNVIRDAFDANNNIEDLCAGRGTPVLMATLAAMDADLAREIDRLFEHCFTQLFKKAAVRKKYGDLRTAYDQVRVAQVADTCAFCGLELLKKEKGSYRNDLDHWLPKSKYPFTAVNFNNLAPICHTCNSKTKLAQDPLHDAAGKRRKAFYPFSANIPGVEIKISLNKMDVGHLKRENVTVQVTCPSHHEELGTWKELFKIDERYREACTQDWATDWFNTVVDDIQTYTNKSPAECIAKAIRQASWAHNLKAPILKAPFLRACEAAGAFSRAQFNNLQSHERQS